MIIHGVVRLPYDEFKVISERMSARFATYLINQHDADDQVKSTHCHFLVDISGSFGNADSLRKNYFKKMDNYKVIAGKCMELHNVTHKEKLLYDRLILAKYIMKGNMPLQAIGFTQIELINLMAEWRPPPDEIVVEAKTIEVKNKKKSMYKVLIEMLEEPDVLFGCREGSEDFLTYDTKLKTLRVSPEDLMSIVIRVLRRNELTPHPQQIDRFVGSMFNMVVDVNYDDFKHCSLSRYTRYKFSQA